MKSGSVFSVVAIGCLLFFVSPHEVLATSSDIILSEILIGTEKASDENEFVELYNLSSLPVDISNFRLRYQNSKGTEYSLAEIDPGSCIPAHGYFLWANENGGFATLANITTKNKLTENYTVLLYLPKKQGDIPLDAIAWGSDTTPPAPPIGQSLTRDLSDQSWLPTLTTPTPTKSAPCPAPDPIPDPDPTPPPVPSTVLVRFNEILPNPIGDDGAGEFIELYNEDTADADISGFIIRDASKTGDYIFPKKTVIPGQGYLVLWRSISKLALNNSNETLSLFGSSDTIASSIHYDKTKEGVSLNYTATGWRGGIPTPGAINVLNSLPETKERVPKKGYRGVPVSFDARGKDADGGVLKYVWNFGDDHKSYKEKTAHTYEENGSYTLTLTTTDGSDDVVETFTLDIESFPKPKVRITAMIPNPSGKDTENEWLTIENRGKKSVDLKGFGIATGWKKLINHPIRESFVIAPKSEAKLTREFSLFTLPNEKGKIELRAPDGTVLQKIKYKLAASAVEDAVYKKEKGKRWEWRSEAPNENDPEDSGTEQDETSPLPDESLTEPATVEEAGPAEKSLPDKTATQVVLGAATVTEHKTDRGYLKLLNYGTSVMLPENITLSFSESVMPEPLVPKKHYAVTFAEKILTTVNTALNAVQNEE